MHVLQECYVCRPAPASSALACTFFITSQLSPAACCYAGSPKCCELRGVYALALRCCFDGVMGAYAVPVPAQCEDVLWRVLGECCRRERGLQGLEDPGSPVWHKARQGTCARNVPPGRLDPPAPLAGSVWQLLAGKQVASLGCSPSGGLADSMLGPYAAAPLTASSQALVASAPQLGCTGCATHHAASLAHAPAQ